jgi:transcriptional regulator with XRE-family HTH domain
MRLKQTVAGNIRRLRLQRGYTQEELSGLAGINRNYTGMIERGQRSPTVDTLEKLAKALEVDAMTLVSRDTAESQAASESDDGAS